MSNDSPKSFTTSTRLSVAGSESDMSLKNIL